MWTLTGFADEIDRDLDIQLQTLALESIFFLDLRAVWGKNVVNLSYDEVARLRLALKDHGVRVSAIGSPIGKIGITDDFAPHLDDFRRVLEIAHTLDAPFVRVFSFFIPEGDDPDIHREAVLERLNRLLTEAEGSNVTLLHENERHIYGDIPARCADIHTAINSPRLQAVWDPANFVLCGVKPFSEGYAKMRPFIAYVHVKDALADSGRVVPAGEGDGELRETIAALRESGFDGFFSLEPHLLAAGSFSGFSGPDLYRKAAAAFKGLLREQGIEWT